MRKILAVLGILLTFSPNVFADEKAADQSSKANSSAEKKPTKTSVAMLTVKGSLPESAGQLGLFGELEVNLSELLSRLDRVANDKAMSGVVLKIRNPDIGPGKFAKFAKRSVEFAKPGRKSRHNWNRLPQPTTWSLVLAMKS